MTAAVAETSRPVYSLTPKLAAALRALQLWQARHGEGLWPGWDRIALILGKRNKGGAAVCLYALEERGRIVLERHRPGPGWGTRITALRIIAPVPVSRAPDGQPLHFVPAPAPAPAPSPAIAEAA